MTMDRPTKEDLDAIRAMHKWEGGQEGFSKTSAWCRMGAVLAEVDALTAELGEACERRDALAESRRRWIGAFAPLAAETAPNSPDENRAPLVGIVAERDEALAALPSHADRAEGGVREASWSVFAEKVVAERDEARAALVRLRIAAARANDGPHCITDPPCHSCYGCSLREALVAADPDLAEAQRREWMAATLDEVVALMREQQKEERDDKGWSALDIVARDLEDRAANLRGGK